MIMSATIPGTLLLAALAWSAALAGDVSVQGGGEFVIRDHGDELTPEMRFRMRQQIDRNVAQLRFEGKLPQESNQQRANPLLTWPLRSVAGLTDNGVHGISNFVDQDPAFAGMVLDYACGTRSSDQSTANHQGVDFFTWPFGWQKMDLDQVEVVAAAAGTITFKHDGEFDRNCFSNSSQWNVVVLQHGDGSETWYGHLKNGSLTTKGIGETVAAGEKLGVVGSSGNSTGPHLHFETYDSSGALNDPYSGACNSMNANSWWVNQRPYNDSALNHLATGFAPPNFPSCPQQEQPNEQKIFNPGDTIYFSSYYRDQLNAQISNYRIIRPDGSLFNSWNHNSPAVFFESSFWWWAFNTLTTTGIWRFEIEYLGQIHTSYFSIGANNGSGRVPGQNGLPSPLVVGKGSGDELLLDWAVSCTATDVEYEIYEGSLGLWYSHEPVTCATGGATAATISPGATNHYYLVVPTDTITEGSHGWDSAGSERPTGASTCLAQQVAVCP